MTALFYDQDGHPIPIEEWKAMIEDNRIARTRVGHGPGKKLISTVWLGLNHNYMGGPPLIFETMMFWKGSKLLLARHSTKQQAVDAHDEFCGWYRYNRRQRRKGSLYAYWARKI